MLTAQVYADASHTVSICQSIDYATMIMIFSFVAVREVSVRDNGLTTNIHVLPSLYSPRRKHPDTWFVPGCSLNLKQLSELFHV